MKKPKQKLKTKPIGVKPRKEWPGIADAMWQKLEREYESVFSEGGKRLICNDDVVPWEYDGMTARDFIYSARIRMLRNCTWPPSDWKHRLGARCDGNGYDFRNGRQFYAWLGLVPRQYSTGGETRLGHITKRGDSYLRMLLVMGARSVVNRHAILTGFGDTLRCMCPLTR